MSDNGAGVATLYNANVPSKIGLTVSVPTAPTGQVFNSTAASFKIDGAKPNFIFDGEDGAIQGWTGAFGTTAHVAVTSTDGAVYKGLALGSTGGADFLYATDFHGGVVEVYKNDFSTVSTFTDPNVAAGYAPFNAEVLNGELYVTYALQDGAKHDSVAGAGDGYVDVFNLDGTFNRRIASVGDEINSPWGLAIAPSSFQNFAGDLLVGNFGDGTISAFDAHGGGFKGKLLGTDGNPLVYGDLWALTPGNGATGSTQSIYFTAGLLNESHGLLGAISAAPVPEPGSWAIMILGLGGVGAALRRRRGGAALSV